VETGAGSCPGQCGARRPHGAALPSPRRSVGPFRLHLRELPRRTVQGWTIGVAVDGSAEIRSITRAGTSADTVENGGYLGAALGRIDIIDPAKNGGQKGVFDSAVLDLVGTPGAVMPPVGTQTILKIVLAAPELQGDADQRATLRFHAAKVPGHRRLERQRVDGHLRSGLYPGVGPFRTGSGSGRGSGSRGSC
jgi:hypothetical protein